MMKVLLLLGLLALAEARWVPDDSPLQRNSDREAKDELRDLEITKLVCEIIRIAEARERAGLYNRDVSLEEQAKALAEARWVPDDNPLQRNSDRVVEDELQDLEITKLLCEVLRIDEARGRAGLYNRDVSLKEQAKALQISDAISGIQGNHGEEGEERRQASAGGRPVSNPSGSSKDYGFMDVSLDTQPMDESVYRY